MELFAEERGREIKRPRLWILLASAFAIYLPFSMLLTKHAWTRSSSRPGLCGCGDPAMFSWFFAWPAHALAHFQNPFFSSAVMAPHGLNLLSATSVEALSIPLVPVTWLWGPIVAMNLAITLIPLLTALTMTACLAHFLRNRWLALPLAGCLAFSPFVISGLRVGHLNVAAIFLVPLMILGFDELARTQQHRAKRVGIALGLLLALQLLISSEQFLFSATALALASMVSFCLLGAEIRQHFLIGIIAAASTAALLAAPLVLFALLGPGHLEGAAWSASSVNGMRWGDLGGAAKVVAQDAFWRRWTGALSPTMVPMSYVGWFTIALAALAVALRRSALAYALAAVAVTSMLLSLAGDQALGVWRFLYRLPLLSSVLQLRIMAYALVALLVLVALLIDGLCDRAQGTRGGGRLLWLVAIICSLALMVNLPFQSARDMPLTMTAVGEPAWFAAHGHSLKGATVLPIPAAFSPLGDALSWQAQDDFGWRQVGFEGPQGLPRRAGNQSQAVKIVNGLSASFTSPLPTASPRKLAVMRSALRAWGVRYIVVPTDLSWPSSGLASTPNYASAFFTAALSQLPSVDHRALIWDIGSHRLGEIAKNPESAVAACWKAPQTQAAAYEVARCVLARSPER